MRAARLSVFALALTTAVATTANADVIIDPGGSNSTVPGHVVVVALGPAGADAATGHCAVTVRNLANSPVAGSSVVFDFSNCPDVRLATDQLDASLTVDCANHRVIATTGADGVASFTIIGGGTLGPPGAANSLHIFADGVLLATPSVAVLDRDGVNGLSGADLGLWAADLFSSTNPPRADFNGDGLVSGSDLSIFAAAFFNGHNLQSARAYCP